MYYYISIIALSMLSSGEPILERSVTGPFENEVDCILYSKQIESIVNQTPTSYIVDAKCKKKDKGKAV